MAFGKIIIVLTLFLFSGSAWAYTSTIGKFSVDFPGQPKMRQAKEKTIVGSVGQNFFEIKNKQGHFTVEYSVLPKIAVFLGGRKTIYRRAVKSFLKKTGSTEISVEASQIADKPATTLKYQTAKGHPGQAHFILVGHTIYVVLAESPKGKKVIEPFLNSFKLLP